MSGIQELIKAVEAVKLQPVVRSGRFSAKLDPVQTREAEARIGAVANALVENGLTIENLPSSGHLLLALLRQVTGDVEMKAEYGEAISAYVERVLYPAPGAKESHEGFDGGKRTKGKRGPKKR